MSRLPLLLLASLVVSVPIRAESGDAAAVVQYCGTPSAEQQEVSPVTNKMERNLTYGNIILHFEPAENGWTFLSGWYDHLPMTKKMVEGRMPCFQQAMAASIVQQPNGPAASEDPAIRDQTAAPATDTSTFGIPHLWLIFLLAGLVILLFFLPGARRRASRSTEGVAPMRYRRRPMLDRFRRDPRTRLDQ